MKFWSWHREYDKTNASVVTPKNESKLKETLTYIKKPTRMDTNDKEKATALVYLQKTICNAITFGDYAYKTVRRPHSSMSPTLWFLPREYSSEQKYDYKRMDAPVYLEANKTPFIIYPWNNERIIDNFETIGNDVNNPFRVDDNNIQNIYVYPLNIVMCINGNHSQYSALIKGELQQVKVDAVYNIKKVLRDVKISYEDKLESDGSYDFEGSMKKEDPKILDLFRVGLKLQEYPEVFPAEIKKIVSQM